MNIARIVDGEVRYPYTLGSLRVDFPNTSWPQDWALIDLDLVGCVEVQSVQAPEVGPSQYVNEAAPEFVDGLWRQAWTIIDIPPEVPESVPAHHFQRALFEAGLLETVEAAIAALPPNNLMRFDWAKAPYFNRDSVGIAAMAQQLGVSDAQLDAIFISAGEMVT